MLRRWPLLRCFTIPTVLVAACTGALQGADAPVEYNRDVLPILATHCFSCHGFDAKSREAGLRLDVREGATAPLESGVRAVVAGKPGESELIRRICTSDADEKMPPAKSGKQLTAAQKTTLRRWIEQGAAYQKHWAFVAPRKIEPPKVPGVEHPIDRFVAGRLASEDLRPSPTAAPETQIRRVSLDLTGLPPTPAEVDAFAAAAQSDPEGAYRRLVDRLLAQTAYGERWGRWWLDQARYADSNGYSIDAPREIWKYRDWVIDALNADMPFDRFTVEQLAGDLLPGATQSQKVATGFHRNTQINQEGGIDKEQFRIDSVFDRTATTGTVWLGLTIGCAQCHNHKFDPIETKEYYRLFAFFNNQDEPTLKVFDAGVDGSALKSQRDLAEKNLQAYLARHSAEFDAWEAGLSAGRKETLPADAKKLLSVPKKNRSFTQHRALFAAGPGAADEEFRLLNERWLELDGRFKNGVTTMVLQERKQPRKTSVLINGDFTRPGDEVRPGTPAVLHPLATAKSLPDRLDLAQWLVSPLNPLTARVVVNRLWQHYFGRGLVETDSDFGLQGTPPSHPQLLDWLAVEFIEQKWSLKAMHRLITTSHAYRQSSLERPELKRKDPHNYLLGRQRRLRLDAEIVRDVSLAACGLLSSKRGGPPVYPPIPDGVMSQGQVKRTWTVSPGEDKYRRGIYTFVYRATPPPALNVFDAPDGINVCTRRIRSNTPLQALTLLNDASFFEFAQALAKIIDEDGLATAFRRCTSRRPRREELDVLSSLDSLSAARTLLNLDETITRE